MHENGLNVKFGELYKCRNPKKCDASVKSPMVVCTRCGYVQTAKARKRDKELTEKLRESSNTKALRRAARTDNNGYPPGPLYRTGYGSY